MFKESSTIIFFILLTITAFILSNRLYLKFKLSILNPVLISVTLIIIFLILFKIPYSIYYKGGVFISGALGPLVVVLAIPLYKNRQEIIKIIIPIIGGTLAGILTSFATVYGLCYLFKIDSQLMLSLLSKSITTPMAVESTKILGGNISITAIAVSITGIIGSITAPAVMKAGKIKNNIAKGIGIGTSSHALGTTKAIEMGEEIGAASGLAIGVTGIITIIGIIIFLS